MPDIEGAMKRLRDSIDCVDAWHKCYQKTADMIARISQTHWNFEAEDRNIFAQIDAFKQRCVELLDVCECELQFARRRRGKPSELPVFGGSRGPDIEKGHFVVSFFLSFFFSPVLLHVACFCVQGCLILKMFLKT